MKKIFKNLVLVAAAAVALTSCQKEPIVAPVEDGFKINATATIGGDTKTVIGPIEVDSESFPVLWSEGDQIRLYEMSYVKNGDTYTNDMTFENNAYGTASLIEGGKRAEFNGIAMPKDPSDDANVFDYFAVYGGDYTSVYGRNKANNKQNLAQLEILAEQAITTDDQFAEGAGILFASVMDQPKRQGAVELNFKHVTAYAHLTISGLNAPDETIKKIEITSNNHYIAGNILHYYTENTPYSVSAEDGYSYKTITLDVTALNEKVGEDNDYHFAAVPTEFRTGDKLTFKITTDVATYTKEIEIDAEHKFDLVMGSMIGLEVSFEGIEAPAEDSGTKYELVTDASTLAEGDEVILVSGNISASGYASSKFNTTTVTINDNTIELDSDTTVERFTLGKEGSNWTIYSISQEKFVGYNSSTNFKLETTTSDNSMQWTIASHNTTDNTFKILNVGNTTRAILYGTSQNKFAPYSTTNATGYNYPQIYRKVVAVDVIPPQRG